MKHITHSFRDLLKQKDGWSVIEIAVIFFIGMIFLSVSYEYFRVQITANNIKDAYERAILTVAMNNYNEVYAGFREEKPVGGEYEGGPAGGGNVDETPEWVPIHDYGNVTEALQELLSLEEGENSIYSETEEYSLSDMNIQVRNAEDTERNKYEVIGNVKMKIPLYFGNIKVKDIEIPIKVRTAYTAKY